MTSLYSKQRYDVGPSANKRNGRGLCQSTHRGQDTFGVRRDTPLSDRSRTRQFAGRWVKLPEPFQGTARHKCEAWEGSRLSDRSGFSRSLWSEADAETGDSARCTYIARVNLAPNSSSALLLEGNHQWIAKNVGLVSSILIHMPGCEDRKLLGGNQPAS